MTAPRVRVLSLDANLGQVKGTQVSPKDGRTWGTVPGNPGQLGAGLGFGCFVDVDGAPGLVGGVAEIFQRTVGALRIARNA